MFQTSLFSYILLLFENDHQRKKIFHIAHSLCYGLLKYSPLDGDLSCNHSFADKPMQICLYLHKYSTIYTYAQKLVSRCFTGQ